MRKSVSFLVWSYILPRFESVPRVNRLVRSQNMAKEASEARIQDQHLIDRLRRDLSEHAARSARDSRALEDAQGQLNQLRDALAEAMRLADARWG